MLPFPRRDVAQDEADAASHHPERRWWAARTLSLRAPCLREIEQVRTGCLPQQFMNATS